GALATACAAQSSSGPTTSLPDAATGTPQESSTTADAAAVTTADADTPNGQTSVDAEPTAGDASKPPPMPGDDGNESYTCTLIIGINATSEWYSRGFESMVDNAKWEI